MKNKMFLYIILIVIVFSIIVFYFFTNKEIKMEDVLIYKLNLPKLEGVKIMLGEEFTIEYTCDGKNENPEIIFPKKGVYAVILEDPDAPAGTWFHWGIIIWDSDKIPKGLPKVHKGDNFIQVHNDFYYYGYLRSNIKGIGYDGPCPPKGHGHHRYFFEIFELKKKPEKEITEKQEIINFIKENAIASYLFISKYKR